MKTCFFIGHRDAPQEIAPKLDEAVNNAIAQHGVTTFLVGHYGNFDRMAAASVIRAKARHKSVLLFMLLPYRSDTHYEHLPDGFNGVFCPFNAAPADVAAIPIANKYAISHCDHLISYVCHEGNSPGFLEFAYERGGIHIVNLAE